MEMISPSPSVSVLVDMILNDLCVLFCDSAVIIDITQRDLFRIRE